jgi:hypothetical protein
MRGGGWVPLENGAAECQRGSENGSIVRDVPLP